jgi:uncharacterized protein (DUF3084 family)
MHYRRLSLSKRLHGVAFGSVEAVVVRACRSRGSPADVVSREESHDDSDSRPISQREQRVKDRERAADTREWQANRRDEAADQREALADQRERLADEREQAADEREGRAGHG